MKTRNNLCIVVLRIQVKLFNLFNYDYILFRYRVYMRCRFNIIDPIFPSDKYLIILKNENFAGITNIFPDNRNSSFRYQNIYSDIKKND